MPMPMHGWRPMANEESNQKQTWPKLVSRWEVFFDGMDVADSQERNHHRAHTIDDMMRALFSCGRTEPSS
uniref:Uncharacterized protein n=1 Tax=Arundo donax TaxID=35708 RepID=A0A0A9DEK7_ARUDO